MVCWKLVRDGVARELEGRSDVVLYRVSGSVLEALLRAKVVEEALEFAGSGSLEEAADLLEALREWLRVRGVGWEELEGVAGEKRRRRGGFSGGFVAIWPGRDAC
ncbi:hypothetical protein CF15_02720 [Pyrodictium occultum]|uniref:Uncharacterized protein n=1 Tax=Pyrodictium occultum TaxID=2309 RepID=A0A0V8RUT4_PYROC|nr:hypothetical protein [Pyrodictium occultum]KSW11746.1 hypothetical protein CF15_02720 [Pyrodictium occultum]